MHEAAAQERRAARTTAGLSARATERLGFCAVPRLQGCRALSHHAGAGWAWGLVALLSLVWVASGTVAAQKPPTPGPIATSVPDLTPSPRPTLPEVPPLFAGPTRPQEGVWFVTNGPRLNPCGDPLGDLAGLELAGVERIDITCNAAETGESVTTATINGRCRVVWWYGAVMERRHCLGLPLVVYG